MSERFLYREELRELGILELYAHFIFKGMAPSLALVKNFPE